ncbi:MULTISPECIES: DUF1285 domain-containing protein [unclassified Moraxella]|uniref:DUF1285 domain-containing protein n=1 Tax=unclassified Moraxella TaxID=2685852 RepID=UPI00359E365C
MMCQNRQNPKNNKNNHNKNNILEDITKLTQSTSTHKIPPLDSWSPTHIHEFDILIKDNGDWYHEGTKMTRQSLVNLFASVLWGQTDTLGNKAYFLKTPNDMYHIQVEDAPLIIYRVDEVVKDGITWLIFTTTNGDEIILNDDNPLYFKDFIKDGRIEQRLYIDTRFGLVARVAANVLYHLVEMGKLCESDGTTTLTLVSGGNAYHLVADR